MAKKKKSTAAEDLLDSLMEDLNVDESELDLGDSQLEGLDSDDHQSLPDGLLDQEAKTTPPKFSPELSVIQDVGAIGVDTPKTTPIAVTPINDFSEQLGSREIQPPSLDQILSASELTNQIPAEIPYQYLEPTPQMQNDIFASHSKGTDDQIIFSSVEEGQNKSASSSDNSDKTFALDQPEFSMPSSADSSMSSAMNSSPPPPPQTEIKEASTRTDVDRTIAVTAFAQKKQKAEQESKVEEKIVIGSLKTQSNFKGSQVFTAVDASLAQAESLKLAQQRILQLEKDLEVTRQENEDLASAAQVIKSRADDLENKLMQADREKLDLRDQFQSEILIIKGHLQHKEAEVVKARMKIEELEGRLKSDFRKIRNKERELENRLELVRAEKLALVRAKDENILDLQRKLDQVKSEIENYRQKMSELNSASESQQDQIRRTVRALRLALTSLDSQSEGTATLTKKAE